MRRNRVFTSTAVISFVQQLPPSLYSLFAESAKRVHEKQGHTWLGVSAVFPPQPHNAKPNPSTASE